MDIKPIRTDEDHQAAIKEIEALWGTAVGTPDGDRLDVLIALADAYEAKRWPLPDVDPVEAIRISMEVEGRSQKDLAAVLGSQARASEILNRKRALTMDMVHKLHQAWHIPASSLIRPYALDRQAG